MYWKGLIVGISLGLWVGLAVYVLRPDDSAEPSAVCPATSCCGDCGSSGHPHPPPVNVAWAPQGPLRYFCGMSDHGGGFIWDHGGGYIWDHGGGYIWDHGGGYVWDHGGGYIWDHGGGYIWDHGGGFMWDDNLSEPAPEPGSPIVPIPGESELGRDRNKYEYSCETGTGGIDDVAVLKNGVRVVIVMPDGNEDFQCAGNETDGAEIIDRIDTATSPISDVRAYCMVVGTTTNEFVDPVWP
jgi:hypothetical protein